AAPTAPALPSLRLLVFGGEALRPSALTPFRAVNPQVRVLNMYGITETTVHVTVHDLPAGHATGTSPVGRPLDGLTVHVLDDLLRPVGVGGTGVLYVAGAQVSRGYVGMPGLTAGRFVADPFLGGGRRMYCSNDVVRVLPDGTLDYVGRADRQVQLRGFRIEPGEVEAALRSVSGVTDAAVAVVDGPGGEELRAAVVTDGPGSAGSGRDLAREARRAARSAVPAYMVPQVVAVVDALPVTVNGKRDDAALQRLLLSAGEDTAAGAAGQDGGTGAAGTAAAADAATGTGAPLDAEAGAAAADAATGTDTAGTVAAVIADVLDLDGPVAPDDDFLRLGGDSILAIRVTHALTRAGVPATPRDVFLGRTPRGIAARVGAPAADGPTTPDAAPAGGDGGGSAASTPGTDPVTGPYGEVPAPAILRRQAELGLDDTVVQVRRLATGVTDGRLTVDVLRRAVAAVRRAHPALGARVTVAADGGPRDPRGPVVRMVVPDPRGGAATDGAAADGAGVTDGATAVPEVPVVVADDVRVLAGHVSLAAGTPLVLGLPGDPRDPDATTRSSTACRG
ncbi:non-ribosomal peptide synthetase, partial [Corynebacterium bovis]|uniref:non-ribosomal peptide synthetase n=1 Tax=Corynebacterium bovis TaxID=36808 RepID=UPI00313A34B1